MEKTNAMRLLERAGAAYAVHTYEGGALSGTEVARQMNEDAARVYKTLVTVGSPRKYYVFVIPVGAELDLKKAAKAAGAKSVSMIRQKELEPLTGYVHGGCSPVGMKKRFRTFLDASAQNFAQIYVSAGKPGQQMKLSPGALASFCGAAFAELKTE